MIGLRSTKNTTEDFSEILKQWPIGRVRDFIGRRTSAEAGAAIESLGRTPVDLAALVSPAASGLLEPMAQRSAGLTRRRFGNILQFYAPLYVSNYCRNFCRYCGFNRGADVRRRALTVDEAMADAEYLSSEGFRHILLVSGEDPSRVPPEYFENLITLLCDRFASISIEIYPLDRDGYLRLVDAGADGLTLYQETYDPLVYTRMHPAGPKKDFRSRLRAIECGAAAGMQSLGIGALLGLSSWREEAFYIGMHALYLQRRYWRSHVSVSFPRMRRAAGGIAPQRSVDDSALVQMICALRLILPDAGLVLSTRESARLRDNLLPIGITRLSAASVTEPGGYVGGRRSGTQFEVQDKRSLREMADAVKERGFDPVLKDWDAAYRYDQGVSPQ